MKLKDTEKTKSILASFAKITIYTDVMEDEIVKKYSRLIRLLNEPNSCEEELLDCYHDVLSMLIKRYGINGQAFGDLWRNHIIDLILADENVFSLA